MNTVLRAAPIVAGVLIALIAIGWLGLKISPAPFAPYPETGGEITTVPLPDDLPAPVERFYRTVYGEQVPVVGSAIISGRAMLRPFGGITFPSRYRFTHDAGQGYRHYIESTMFGLPIMKVNERYVDDISLMELPVGTVENDPNINQAANLGLWGESIGMLPTILVTDPRVRWEPIDDTSARLIVPFEESGEEPFIVVFDPDTGLLSYAEAMRYKNENSTDKTRWVLEVAEWAEVDGQLRPTVATATWEDEGTPWAVFQLEEVIFNVDVSEYIYQKGL